MTNQTQIDEEEVARRHAIHAEVTALFALEGLKEEPAATAIADRFCRGEISAEEHIRLLDELYHVERR